MLNDEVKAQPRVSYSDGPTENLLKTGRLYGNTR